MRTSILRLGLAAALGLAALGGAAQADIRKDIPKYYPPELIERARLHQAEMNTGKDHYAAWTAVDAAEATASFSTARVAKSLEHEKEMSKGADHASARK